MCRFVGTRHTLSIWSSGPWASYQIRKIAGCACAGNAGNVFPAHRLQGKPVVSDPGMHRGTCGTHVPWCMPGSLTRGVGENVPGIPGACVTRNFTYLARGPLIVAIDNNDSTDWESDVHFITIVLSLKLSKKSFSSSNTLFHSKPCESKYLGIMQLH